MFHQGGVHSFKVRIKLQVQNLIAGDRHAVGGVAVLPGVDLAKVDIAATAYDLKLLADVTIVIVSMQPHADQAVTGALVFQHFNSPILGCCFLPRNPPRFLGQTKSSRLSPSGPSAGLLNLRYVRIEPALVWIAAAVSVIATTGLPFNSHITPVASYRAKRL
jgi:hypothetical protein